MPYLCYCTLMGICSRRPEKLNREIFPFKTEITQQQFCCCEPVIQSHPWVCTQTSPLYQSADVTSPPHARPRILSWDSLWLRAKSTTGESDSAAVNTVWGVISLWTQPRLLVFIHLFDFSFETSQTSFTLAELGRWSNTDSMFTWPSISDPRLVSLPFH